MKITLISGSHRPKSQSEKVARYTQTRLKDLMPDNEYELFSLANNPLPLWDEGVWQNSEMWKKNWSLLAEKLRSSDGFVVVSPEWGGMVPAGLKNFFLLCGMKELGHKPALIITVSAARGGAYPVAELRMSSYKNTGICYLPEHIIVRNSEHVLNDTPSNSEEDNYLRKRIDYALKILGSYTKSLKQVRDSGVLNFKEFANGM